MPKLRESTTAVIVRGERVKHGFTTEPYEAGWAGEAILFLVGLDDNADGSVRVQISPDGMHWINEGTACAIPPKGEVSFARVAHFGNWLRFAAEIPAAVERRLTATLHLKG